MTDTSNSEDEIKGAQLEKAIIDEAKPMMDKRDNPEKHLLKYLNISNLKRLTPKSASYYDKAFAIISQRKARENKYTDADKFALGITDCGAEQEFMIKADLMYLDNSGQIHMTERGLLMAAAIYNKYYSGESQARQIVAMRKIQKNRKKNKLARQARKKNRR
jgi:hypothetical protein